MKKFLTALLLVFILASVSCAASSNDVYVRQDVFDAKMDLLFAKIDALETKMDAKFDALESRLNAKIDGVETRLNAKIDAVDNRLNAKIDAVNNNLNAKIDAVNNSLNAKIDESNVNLNAKIDDGNVNLNAKIDVLDARITNVENNVSWWIGGLTLFLTGLALIPLIWALVEKFRRPLITLDDVQRLIAEELSKLSPIPQVS